MNGKRKPPKDIQATWDGLMSRLRNSRKNGENNTKESWKAKEKEFKERFSGKSEMLREEEVFEMISAMPLDIERMDEIFAEEWEGMMVWFAKGREDYLKQGGYSNPYSESGGRD